MLVLKRTPGQSIMIADAIEVKILSVSGTIVKIGIKAPGDLKILRSELLVRTKEQEKG